MPEVYISVDIEADGKRIGDTTISAAPSSVVLQHGSSMLSIGAASFTRAGGTTPLSTFSANLDLLPGAIPDPETMAWWQQSRHRDAYAATRLQTRPPRLVIPDFLDWVTLQPGLPVFVAYPAGFDFSWMYWYINHFSPERNPFAWSALDLKTLAMALMRSDYRQATKRNMPRSWFTGGPPHTHIALDDAIGQGVLCINMLRELYGD